MPVCLIVCKCSYCFSLQLLFQCANGWWTRSRWGTRRQGLDMLARSGALPVVVSSSTLWRSIQGMYWWSAWWLKVSASAFGEFFLPTVQVQEFAKESGLSSMNVLRLEGVRRLPTISMWMGWTPRVWNCQSRFTCREEQASQDSRTCGWARGGPRRRTMTEVFL